MRESKFTSEQIAYCQTHSQTGVPISEPCRKYGISQQIVYPWKARFGGLATSDVQRLKDLEEENGRPEKLVADLSVDKAILQVALRKKL